MNDMNTNADETDSDNSNLTSGTDLLEIINELSDAYLLGSEWYIGEEYPFDYFFNTIDQNIKHKIYYFLFFMNTLYQKLD